MNLSASHPIRRVIFRNGRCPRSRDTQRLQNWPIPIRTARGITILLALMFRPACADELTGARFSDVTARSQIQFRHHSPLTAQRHLHLTMGSGVAWIDFDCDGWPDLYCAQGKTYPLDTVEPEENGRGISTAHSDAILRNQRGTDFSDVSSPAGILTDDYAMGLAPGDFNNDGFPDLYVTTLGKNRLHRNNGDGTFTETASENGMDHAGYGASSTWVDLNNDGSCDLFVVNYLNIDHQDYPLCTTEYQGRTFPIVCPPRQLEARHDVLYASVGDGRFQDISQSSGLHAVSPAPGLGVVAADFDADGNIDVYVANDSVPNHLWVNQGNLRMKEEGDLSGTSLNRYGAREAGMAAVAGDLSGNHRPDLFVTNYFNETNTLYRNEGYGLFLDVTSELGLAGVSRLKLGFGASLLDANGDGWLDLFVANGHVNDLLTETGRNEPFAQLSQLLLNREGRRFDDVAESAGNYFQTPLVGRSSSVADFNHDGRPDLAVLHLNGPVILLENHSVANPSPPVVAIQLVGTMCNRDAIGAVVEVKTDSGLLVRHQLGSCGYLSADERRMTISIPAQQAASEVRVHWPGGDSETWPVDATGALQTLIQSLGTPLEK